MTGKPAAAFVRPQHALCPKRIGTAWLPRQTRHFNVGDDMSVVALPAVFRRLRPSAEAPATKTQIKYVDNTPQQASTVRAELIAYMYMYMRVGNVGVMLE